MSTYKNIEEIKRDYDNGDYFCHMEVPKKVSANHIFDTNVSVTKNREMVQKHNDEVQRLRKEKNKQSSILAKKLSEDVIIYLIEEYGLKNAQAARLESFIYNKYHSHMSDYFAEIDEFADVVTDILND